MKGFELKVKVSIEREDGYKEVSISNGYDRTKNYTNLRCRHLETDKFIASCIASYVKKMNKEMYE